VVTRKTQQRAEDQEKRQETKFLSQQKAAKKWTVNNIYTPNISTLLLEKLKKTALCMLQY
jgi:hypothetical protein